MKKTRVLQLRNLTEDFILKLKQEALQHGISPSELVRRAVSAYIGGDDDNKNCQQRTKNKKD